MKPFAKTIAIFGLALLSQSSFAGQKQWTFLDQRVTDPDQTTSVRVIRSSGSETEIAFTLKGFSLTTVQTSNGNALVISSNDLTPLLQAGAPDVSKMAFSVAIPDQAEMVVDELNSSYVSYQNIDIAPSKGNLYRNTDPAAIPYSYGPAYSANEFYPGSLVQLQQPYIVRDLRGQAVWVFPFQYNPVTKELRVYTEIHFRIKPNGTSAVNALTRTKPYSSTDPVYASVYKSLFVNSNTIQYAPLAEDGKMLVICYDAFLTAMQPFVEWKNRMGLPTEMVPFSAVGTTDADLKDYISDYYDNNGLTFVLLVGDGDQIPVASTSSGESDPSLGYLTGNDSYAEVIIGRFSAESVEQVETQVARTIQYEANPDPAGQWYGKAVCIGSDQGPGDDNEMDYEHERNISLDELAYTYTVADELYDGSQGGMDANGDPDPIDLVNSLNDGRGIITYTGHGSCGAFSTTGFSNADVSTLTNVDQLPFIWSVACVNGQFNGYDCLGEAFLRAVDPTGKATGAVATLMSTINQSWDPPMDAQDEFIDLLTEQYGATNSKRTFGGISVNGCMHMNDQYGSAGDEMTDTWTCFGDPSLMVRSMAPAAMTVSHDLVIDETASTFMVNCNTDGALVCLSKNNQIISTHRSLLGFCNLQNISGLSIGDTLDLTATASNALPYFGKVVVTSMTGLHPLSGSVSGLNVFPSVTSADHVTVQYSLQENSSLKVEIVNSLGQVMTGTTSFCEKGINETLISLSGFSKGVYYIRLSVNGASQTAKVITL